MGRPGARADLDEPAEIVQRTPGKLTLSIFTTVAANAGVAGPTRGERWTIVPSG